MMSKFTWGNQNLDVDLNLSCDKPDAQLSGGWREAYLFYRPQVTYNNHSSNKCYLEHILQCKMCFLLIIMDRITEELIPSLSKIIQERVSLNQSKNSFEGIEVNL